MSAIERSKRQFIRFKHTIRMDVEEEGTTMTAANQPASIKPLHQRESFVSIRILDKRQNDRPLSAEIVLRMVLDGHVMSNLNTVTSQAAHNTAHQSQQPYAPRQIQVRVPDRRKPNRDAVVHLAVIDRAVRQADLVVPG